MITTLLHFIKKPLKRISIKFNIINELVDQMIERYGLNRENLKKEERIAIGLMSNTSADGIDAILVALKMME